MAAEGEASRANKTAPSKAAAAKATPAEKAAPTHKAAPPRKAATPKRPAKAAAPAKRTPRKTTNEPTEALTPTPAEIIKAAEEVTPAEGQNAVETRPTDPWASLIANPGRAPEFLALAAVQTLGPRARDWATQTRASYPNATNQALSRLAAGQFTRVGTVGSALSALAGSYAPAALLASAGITEAELTLHVAAAHGFDPTDPDRAADLLVIAHIHPTIELARDAIKSRHGSKSTLMRIAAGQTAGWALVKLASRLFPGTAFLTALLTGTNAAANAAARADAYYRRKESQD